jgi:hypothetical protein
MSKKTREAYARKVRKDSVNGLLYDLAMITSYREVADEISQIFIEEMDNDELSDEEYDELVQAFGVVRRLVKKATK